MNQEQIELAKKLISQSKILSSLEKAEWLQLLPEMNDKQILELTRILTPKFEAPAAPIPSAAAPAAPSQKPKTTAAAQPPQNLPHVDITQKELSTSIPFYEQQLAAPSQPKPAPVQDLPKPQSSLPPRQPQQPLQQQRPQPQPRAVSDRMPLPNLDRPEIPNVPARTPTPQTGIPDLAGQKDVLPPLPHAAELKNKTVAPGTVAELKLEFKSIDDFIKLTPGMLHGRDPYRVLQSVLNTVAEFAKNKKGVAAIYSVERSPLYKAYIDYGMALLNQSTAQRELSQQEFEAFADFRKELDNLVI